MQDIERSPTELRVRSDCLELAFRYCDDRWFHELLVRDSHRCWTLLRSIEGGADDPIPVSPALQDLRLEQLGEQVFEFQGMGQAGAAIYSAAIRVDLVAREVAFDLCVRGKRADSRVQAQSLYEVMPETVITDSIPLTLTVNDSDARLRISPIRINGQPECESRKLERDGAWQIVTGCFSIDTCAAEAKARSIRWAYRFTLDGLP